MLDWFLSLWSEDWRAFFVYISGGAHQEFYASFGLILLAAFFGGLLALAFGLLGASVARSNTWGVAVFGRLYINTVRGIPDLLFLVFFPLAMTLTIKIVRTWLYCTSGTALFDGINFVGCAASGFLTSPNSWQAFIYDFMIACLALGLVYGAFVANVIRGALDTVPAAQLETARAFGMTERQVFWRILVPQMWVYAWGGLTNSWMLLVKSTSLLSLMGIFEAVWWTVNKLGPPQPRAFVGYVHGDWTVYYFGILLIFYLAFTFASETAFAWGQRRVSRGMISERRGSKTYGL